MVKPPYGSAMCAQTLNATVEFFEKLLQILHPFIPFITEELWHETRQRSAEDCIMVSSMPVVGPQNPEMLARFELMQQAVTAIRSIRKARNIPFRDALELRVSKDENYPSEFEPVLRKMAGLSGVVAVDEKPQNCDGFIVKTTGYFVPVGDNIDREAELAKLTEELKYQEGFLASVMKKLGNERFVSSAPAAVVAGEEAKRSDAQARIAALKERIGSM